MQTRTRRLVGVMSAVVVLLCCSSVRGDTAAQDQQAKTFSPAAGTAAIYIYRKNGRRGSAGTFPVTVDGKYLGRISNGTFYWLEVEPGEHEVWVGWAENTPRTPNDPLKSLAKVVLIPIAATAGQSYFVRVAQQGQEHVAVADDAGKVELLACCQLVEQDQSGSTLFR